jgi:hypothetical protein
MSSSGDAPPPAKQEVVEGVLGAVAAGIAGFLATPSNAADRKVVVVQAVWNEIPPLWGAVRLTLWVTVDVHGTVHNVAYQDSDSEPRGDLVLMCPTNMNDCGMMHVPANGDEREERDKRKAAFFTCTQRGNPRNPYDCQYGFAVTFTRAPFAVAFPDGLEGVAAGGARPRRMADSVRLVPRALSDIGLFT